MALPACLGGLTYLNLPFAQLSSIGPIFAVMIYPHVCLRGSGMAQGGGGSGGGDGSEAPIEMSPRGPTARGSAHAGLMSLSLGQVSDALQGKRYGSSLKLLLL